MAEIKVLQEKKEHKFSDVRSGECFSSRGCYYLKLHDTEDDGSNVVSLTSGITTFYAEQSLVDRVFTKITLS